MGMKTLFLCHGKLHLREVDFLQPFLSEPDARMIWKNATYIDIDPSSMPTLVEDVCNARSNLLKENTYDFIISVYCPASIYITDKDRVSPRFWNNIATWLKIGGFFLAITPQRLLERRIQTSVAGEPRKPRPVKVSSIVKAFGDSLVHEDKEVLEYIDNVIAHRLFAAHKHNHPDFPRLAKLAMKTSKGYSKYIKWLKTQEVLSARVQDCPQVQELDSKAMNRLSSLKKQVEKLTKKRLTGMSQETCERLFDIRDIAFCFHKARL